MENETDTKQAFGTSTLDKVLTLFDRLDDEMDALCEAQLTKRMVRRQLSGLSANQWAEKLADLEEAFLQDAEVSLDARSDLERLEAGRSKVF